MAIEGRDDPAQSNKVENLSKRECNIATLTQMLEDYVTQHPNIFGGCDILNFDLGKPLVRAGILTAVLAGLRLEDGSTAVRKFVVIVPPGSNVEECEAELWNEFLASFRCIAQRDLEPKEQKVLKARLEIVIAPDRRSSSVIKIISAQKAQSAVIVTEAASYRDVRVEPYVAPDAAAPLLPEDFWAPQLHALANNAVTTARQKNLYVALDANQVNPHREALQKLLLSVERCGVLGSSWDDSRDTVLSGYVDRWDAWIRSGFLGRVLKDIEQLPPSFNRDKAFLRIQVLHKAGFLPEALQGVRELLATNPTLDPLVRVKLSRIAQSANASELAAEILTPAVSQICDREDIESALITAHESESAELEESVARRLEAMFPDSPLLTDRRLRTYLTQRNYAAASALAAEQPNRQALAVFYGNLARYLSVPDSPDYQALIACANGNLARADAYRMACVSDALSRGLVVEALDLAMPIPHTPKDKARGERLVLQTLEAIMLLAKDRAKLPVPIEKIRDAMIGLISALALDPTNHALRIGLADLSRPSVSGTLGVVLLAIIVNDLASHPIAIMELNKHAEANLEWLVKHRAFLETAFDWLKSEEPIVIGRAVLPPRLLTEPADSVVSAVTEYLMCVPLENDNSIREIQLWLAFGSSVTPHSSDPDADLKLIRLVAERLALSGYPQIARDLAEQAILNGTATPGRRRLAWFAMADTYHRCHDYSTALIAMACALASDAKIDRAQAYNETIAIVRLLRDSGLLERAHEAIDKARRRFSELSLDAFSQRLDTLELQIRHKELHCHPSGNERIGTLLADVTRHGAAVLKIDEAVEPVAIMLGQLLNEAKASRAEVPHDAEQVFDELYKRVRQDMKSLLAVAVESEPSAEDLLSIVKTTGRSRYSDDVGFDMNTASIVAARALDSDRFVANPIDTAFALEVLADRGVAQPGWDEAAIPPPSPRLIDEPADIACAISREGVSVLQAGFDYSGRLVRVSAVNGTLQAPVREPEYVIHRDRLADWAKQYPYSYGTDETTTNLFYTTTENLRLSNLPEGPVVVVGDPVFQTFPPNLLFLEDHFAGRTRPMAAAPSLSWLKSARTVDCLPDGRLCAWISISTEGSATQTLPMIAQRLDDTFKQYRFLVDNGPTLPEAFRGASVAIIAAHGGVHPEGRYFQVVSDEGGLQVTAADLANALRNIGVVVLFVCSGGRSDKHPGAHTTLGLARQVLDRGCGAVVASPWPLDARVPSHWLPEFLNQWSQGKPLIQANYDANRVVDRVFSQDPARGLAMTVFGDPMLSSKTPINGVR